VTRRELERRKFKVNSLESFGTTYNASAVALKGAVVDLDSALIHTDSSALEVACPPPGIGAKKVQETSETRFCTTYISSGSVALENACVDLDICTISFNSSALEVACPPPGHRASSGKLWRPSLIHSQIQRCCCS
jgi:hypothetical protein